MRIPTASRLVFGAALVAAGGLFVFAGDTNPPAGPVSSTMRTNQEIFDAVQNLGSGGGGGDGACAEAIPGAPRGGAVVSCSALPGTGASPALSGAYALSQTVTQTAGIGGGGGAGATTVGELTFTRDSDGNSFRFFRACATAYHIPTVTITLSNGSVNHIEYLLTDVIVAAYSPRMVQRCDGTTAQVEDITLRMTKLQVKDLIGGGSFEWNTVPAP